MIIFDSSLKGDQCKIRNQNEAVGVCRLIDDCRSILHDPEKHKKQPQICGFDGLKPIVCCPDIIPSTNLNVNQLDNRNTNNNAEGSEGNFIKHPKKNVLFN